MMPLLLLFDGIWSYVQWIVYTVTCFLASVSLYFFCSPSLGGSGFGVGSLN